jgi:hypothetical protein
MNKPKRCSICGMPEGDGKHLVSSSNDHGPHIHICNSCVACTAKNLADEHNVSTIAIPLTEPVSQQHVSEFLAIIQKSTDEITILDFFREYEAAVLRREYHQKKTTARVEGKDSGIYAPVQ